MNKPHHAGFTLIELMITVVIISILAAIAYPSYTRYVVETRRSDAQIGLTRLGALLEKHYTQCNKYTVTISSGSINACDGLGNTVTTTPEGYYNLAVTDIDPSDGNANTISSNFRIVATPVSGSTQANDGAFRLDSTGAKWWDKDNNSTWDTSESTWKKH